MFEYFYNEIFRKTIIAFGTLFNNIEIQKTDSNGDVSSVIKVPLAYGPTQKFLARINQQGDLDSPVAMTLPRMSFEFTGVTYDPSRKVTTTQRFLQKDSGDGTKTRKAYMPVPYTMQFELSIMSKLNDDALQIVEQILPYFQPQFNLTVELAADIKEKKDIPIILENITMIDDYEGDYTTRRVLTYTLRFSAKTYLFGPIPDVSKDVIKRATIAIGAGDPSQTRELTYTQSVRAIRNYTGNVLTSLSDDVKTTDSMITVDDATGIEKDTYLDINQEEVYVRLVSGNNLTVDRGVDGSAIKSHLKGDSVKSITAADNDLVPFGDDFGFSGSVV